MCRQWMLGIFSGGILTGHVTRPMTEPGGKQTSGWPNDMDNFSTDSDAVLDRMSGHPAKSELSFWQDSLRIDETAT